MTASHNAIQASIGDVATTPAPAERGRRSAFFSRNDDTSRRAPRRRRSLLPSRCCSRDLRLLPENAEAQRIPHGPDIADRAVRAAADIELGKYLALAGGVNTFFHAREPTLVDRQPTIRMNRDHGSSGSCADAGSVAPNAIMHAAKNLR